MVLMCSSRMERGASPAATRSSWHLFGAVFCCAACDISHVDKFDDYVVGYGSWAR